MDTPYNDEPDDLDLNHEQPATAHTGYPLNDQSAPTPITDPKATSGNFSSSSGSATSGAGDDGEKNSVITARGTSEGLVLRIDGRVQAQDLVSAVREFLVSRRSFLAGHDVAFEWVGRKPEDSVIHELTSILSSEFTITVRSSKLRPSTVSIPANQAAAPVGVAGERLTSPATAGLSVLSGSRPGGERLEKTTVPKNVSLFDGIEAFEGRSSGTNSMMWDDPDARVIYGTLRSGQKVESEHTVIVFGDVNSGAEVIAGGDIVILGTLRGIAHAGAYDESGGGRVIFSINLQPTQLRIGLVISRGSGASERGDTSRGTTAEIARVDNSSIVVEPYQSRTVWGRRRE